MSSQIVGTLPHPASAGQYHAWGNRLVSAAALPSPPLSDAVAFVRHPHSSQNCKPETGNGQTGLFSYTRLMQIFLVRHGQSRWQIEQDDRNWDSDLTELGEEQASRLGEWLAAAEDSPFITHIRASTLVRARQTAQLAAGSLNIPLAIDENLCEATFWVSEHLPAKKTPADPHFTHQPSTIYSAFKEQAGQALAALVADAETTQGPVMGIAHGGLISTLLRYVVGSDWVSFWIYNTTLNLLEWKRGRWHLVYLNRWDHLPPHLRTF